MPTSSARSSRRAGYTLAELLVVLVIIGLTLALVAPRLFFTSDGAKPDRAVRSFDTAARAARANARLTGHDVLLTVHLDDGVFRIEPDGPIYELPGDPVLRATVAEAELDPPLAGIRFFPDGSSTGGDIAIVYGERERITSVEWITGRVSVRDAGSGDE